MFPSNYVQLRDDPRPTPPTASHPSAGQGVVVLPKPIIAKVVAAYTRTKESQLNLAVGDLVKVMAVTSTYLLCLHDVDYLLTAI